MDDKKRALMMVGLGVLLLPLLALLPAVAAPTATIIDPGTGNTTSIFQNIGSSTASVVVEYINEDGNVDATKYRTVNRYGAGTIGAARSGLPDGWRGSAVLSSNQPLAAVVQISWSGLGKVGAAYSGLSSPGTEVYLPDVATSSGTDTQITVQNASAAQAQVSVYYYAADGTLTGPKGPYAIPVGAERTLDVSKAVGTSWSGSVRITSTVDIAAVATRHWTSKSAAYQGLSSGSDHLYFPLIYRWKKDGTWRRYTQVQVQNLSGSQATFSLSFYDRSGNLKNVGSQPYKVTVPARGTLRFNMKSGGGGLSRSQVDFGYSWNGSLMVTSDVQMAGTANEIFPKGKRAGASIAEGSGSTRIYLPSLYRKKQETRWVNFSEVSIQNVGDSEASVNIKFYLRDGTLKKSLWGITIPPKASYRFTTKETRLKALGDTFLGTAVITRRQGNVVALVYNKTGPRSHIYNGLRQ